VCSVAIFQNKGYCDFKIFESAGICTFVQRKTHQITWFAAGAPKYNGMVKLECHLLIIPDEPYLFYLENVIKRFWSCG
jgi:hypothetical protein